MQKTPGIRRSLEAVVERDLARKMVFVAGPRQCGKTTLAQAVASRRPSSAYFNWDVAQHRAELRRTGPPEAPLLWVFDEIHKYRSWRGFLKGLYDLHRHNHQILVTGSARLDAYSRGGDSLQGRYYLHRMHPLSLSEVYGLPRVESLDAVPELGSRAPPSADEALGNLLRFGGFPEPLLRGTEREATRWRSAYGTRLVREDVRDLERVLDLDRLELLFERLPATVGSVLSVNSLREDLEIAFGTVKSWLSILERLYAIFRVSPFGPARIKAVKKEQKLYLWDWARAEALPARFENLVMLQLLRLTHVALDEFGEKLELRYFRTTGGHEVDAIVLRKGKPWLAVEVKSSDRSLDRGLGYLLERVHVPFAFQVSLSGKVDVRLPDINGARVRLVPATTFLANLP